jgi:hypothetical protein
MRDFGYWVGAEKFDNRPPGPTTKHRGPRTSDRIQAHIAFEAAAVPNGKSVTSWPSTQISEKLLEVAVRLFPLLGAGRSGDTQED